MTEETVKDWNRSTVAELKEELASRNLQTTGLKKELIKRLQDDDVNNGDEINAEDVVNDVINGKYLYHFIHLISLKYKFLLQVERYIL